MFRTTLFLVLLLGGAVPTKYGNSLGFAGPMNTRLYGSEGEDWGFFAHRRINHLATFTLPADLAVYMRQHVDYLAEHAVDPDKRRYATRHEAVRHYIDLDHWGEAPFAEVPRDYTEALRQYATLSTVDAAGDTTAWRFDTVIDDRTLLRSATALVDVPSERYRQLWYTTFRPALYGDEVISVDSLADLALPGSVSRVSLEDTFSTHGILPYHLADYHERLTRAFYTRDPARILQLAAEMGHYVGDAHVPLHTTENYNGQLTGQLGIHAFWESRLPELFADEEYDYLVGPAEYIADPAAYHWNIVLESHALVDSVLSTERSIRQKFAADRQRCSEERGGRQVSTQCAEYSRAWSEAMNGMVEQRFRQAVRSVGSVWYSCWVDAGQPELPLSGARAAWESPLAERVDTGGLISEDRRHE